MTSYAGYIGGSADNPEGAWEAPTNRVRLNSKYPLADNDAKQWAAWGIDYLKYDWNPRNSNPRETSDDFHQHTSTMAKALRKSETRRCFSAIPIACRLMISPTNRKCTTNCWRTTGDIGDSWLKHGFEGLLHERAEKREGTSKAHRAIAGRRLRGPAIGDDPDMMVLGMVNFGGKQHPTRLKPDEQYLHMTAWSMATAPLLLGCDMDKLDDFTLGLVSNDEVLAIDQDTLGKQATLASNHDDKLLVYARPLEDGTQAVALYNLGTEFIKVTAKWI